MAKRGRKPKNMNNSAHNSGSEVQHRDPIVTNRDPGAVAQKDEKRQYHQRRCIQASMPTICPDCGHNTRQDDGRHIDPVRARIVEYRTCIHCKLPLGAVREMTQRERELLCKGKDIVKDYEELVKSEIRK